MISFVWSSRYPFIAGSGGSETYTAGQIRELIRRGIPTRIVTIGHGEQDGREDFPGIPFLALESKEQLAELDDLIVYITYPLDVATKHPAYAILHCPPPTYAHGDPLYKRNAFKGVGLITASKFAAGIWRRYLKTNFGRMPTVYPFADDEFAQVKRPDYADSKPKRILFAGRLHVDKGIYTLLASLQMEDLIDTPYKLTVTTAGSNAAEGKVILDMLKAHPNIDIVPARKNPAEMAKLIAQHDIVVMPSTNIYWQELFGMLSIESQQAGCRVVASRSGGLPETNIGGLVLVKPDDPKALAISIAAAIKKGALSDKERAVACKQFNVRQSVDSLLNAISYDRYIAGPAPSTATKLNTSSKQLVRSLKQRQTRQPHAAANLPSLIGGQLQRRQLSLAVIPELTQQIPARALKRSVAPIRAARLSK